MIKKHIATTASIALVVLIAATGKAHANAYYDSSTVMAVPVAPVFAAPVTPLMLPRISATTVVEGMIEAQEYSSGTGQRFRFKFADNQAKRRGPFMFAGGSLVSFASTVRAHGLFAEILLGNTLSISSTKYFRVEVSDWRIALLEKELKRVGNLTNLTMNGGRGAAARFSATPQGYKTALGVISAHSNSFRMAQEAVAAEKAATLARNTAIVEQKQALVRAKAEEENAKVAAVNSVNGISSDPTVMPSQLPSVNHDSIRLDQPYTIRTLVRKIEDNYGGKYDVRVDSNIPVNKNVEIKGVDDLNRYLKNTTGESLAIKKSSSGVVIVDKKQD